MNTLSPPRPLRRDRAFTLIELLAVVGVMVLLLSFTLPILRGGNSISKTAWDITGVFEQARGYAMSQNTYVWVGLNEADLSDSMTSCVGTFILASADGTESPSYTEAAGGQKSNLTAIDRVRRSENAQFVDGTRFSGHFSYSQAVAGVKVVSVNGEGEGNESVGKINGLQASDLPRGWSVANTSFLRIDPSGNVSIPGATAPSPMFELRLLPTRGASPVLEDDQPTDSAIVQISSMGGRLRTLRFGDDTTPSSAPPDSGD